MSEETISTTELGDKILLVLKTIYDPEIPVDIYELGARRVHILTSQHVENTL